MIHNTQYSIHNTQYPILNTQYSILNTKYSIPNIRYKFKFSVYLLISYTIFFCSCANQLPPSGGEDDRIPPKIISISPKPNSTNFNDNKIKLVFDEYVDRRSFEESFFISPKPRGKIIFDWSGKEVEVEFTKAFDKNKTYLVIIGKDLRDIRGSNTLDSPLSFAFSTGNKIDEGNISGNVFSENNERIKILAYLKNGKSEDELNPEKNVPDYILQVSLDGGFELRNLPAGNYRIFAISDEDRNNLFDKDFDKIGILPDDYVLTEDSINISNINFLLKEFEINKNKKDFSDGFNADSINYIYSNITEGEKNISPDYRFYFRFRKNNLPKSDIVNNFSIIDSAANKTYRLVFNWINDSLLEVFSPEKFSLSSDLKIKIDLTNTSKEYSYERNISVAGKNSFGKVSGKVISKENITTPVYIKLYNKDNKFITYSARIIDTTEFIFNEVLEGNYILFSFTDDNDDGKHDKGNYYPFKPAEKFIIYDKELKVKGGWNVENVFLKF